MQIQCLISKNSWIKKYQKKLIQKELKSFSKKIYFCENHTKLRKNFDVNIVLSYFKKIPKKNLDFSRHNIVVHGSDLPKGKGMSPISWQILKGRNKIVFTIFEANTSYDDGFYYFKKIISFQKTDLHSEIKHKQIKATIKLLKKFFANIKKLKKKKQLGKSTFYSLRKKSHSQLNIRKSLLSQMNLLRIVDNEKYPAFFYFKKKKYIIKIFKDEKYKN
jgi:methionyl-tRNA formyltransferase|tara:strand:- start:1486 stop:2139 length:654 start_codon:yes stop_codon:yes gene_type:complete